MVGQSGPRPSVPKVTPWWGLVPRTHWQPASRTDDRPPGGVGRGREKGGGGRHSNYEPWPGGNDPIHTLSGHSGPARRCPGADAPLCPTRPHPARPTPVPPPPPPPPPRPAQTLRDQAFCPPRPGLPTPSGASPVPRLDEAQGHRLTGQPGLSLSSTSAKPCRPPRFPTACAYPEQRTRPPPTTHHGVPASLPPRCSLEGRGLLSPRLPRCTRYQPAWRPGGRRRRRERLADWLAPCTCTRRGLAGPRPRQLSTRVETSRVKA